MRAPRIVLFALLAMLLAATAARAEEESLEVPPAAETPPPPAGAWAPPLPSAEEYDWLQVRSGEWLKGELKRLRDGRVIFDSDEFDELDLNWKKVASFYLPRPHSFRVQGRVLFGTAELRGDVLRIRTAEAVVEFDRDELDSIAQGSGRELDWWGLKLGLAANFREGNTESVDIQGDGELRRETATTRFVTRYRGVFSEVDNDKKANNHRVNSDLDLFLTERLFWTIPFGEYLLDEIQNIDARVTVGTALGYDLAHNAWIDVEVTLGGAYQLTQLEGGTDESQTSHDFAVVHTTTVDFDLPGGTEWDNSYRLQLVATGLGKTSHTAESELSLDVWGPLDLDVTFIWDRIEEPAENNNKEPKKDDYRMLVGFSLDF